MRRSALIVLAGFVSATLTARVAPGQTPDTKPSPADDRSEIARRVLAITDVVIQQHVDPPSRQQMVLDGIKAVHEAASVPIPSGMSRQVSDLTTSDQFAGLIVETWPRPSKVVNPKALEDALVHGTFASVPGGAMLVPAKDQKVNEQFDSNLYVGIQIALSFDSKEKRPTIAEVLEGGPADKAGVRKDDLIEEVDGVNTAGLDLGEVVGRLRGEEGTKVVVRLRRPKSGEVFTHTMTRSRLPRKTITGIRKGPDGSWGVRLDGPAPVGYLRFTEIVGSTPLELRELSRQLEAEGVRALVLDLRSLSTARLHPTVLLADYLLDGGTIGRVRTAEAVTPYQAEPDALFRNWPLAVLVDGQTSGASEWLAAALQDNHRAVIVGNPTAGVADVRTAVPLPGGQWWVHMTTGRFERGDGRPLARPSAPGAGIARIPMPRIGAAPNVKGGVTPDHVVGGQPAERRVARIGAPVASDVARDPAVVKAQKILGEALKPAAS